MQRIIRAAADYGLPTPKIEVFDDMFRVSLFRKGSEKNNSIGESIGENIGETFAKA